MFRKGKMTITYRVLEQGHGLFRGFVEQEGK
jgi:hypothetical protein